MSLMKQWWWQALCVYPRILHRPAALKQTHCANKSLAGRRRLTNKKRMKVKSKMNFLSLLAFVEWVKEKWSVSFAVSYFPLSHCYQAAHPFHPPLILWSSPSLVFVLFHFLNSEKHFTNKCIIPSLGPSALRSVEVAHFALLVTHLFTCSTSESFKNYDHFISLMDVSYALSLNGLREGMEWTVHT